MTDRSLPALLPAPQPIAPAVVPPLPRRERVLLPERSDFLEGDEAADDTEMFLVNALDTIAANPEGTAHADA